jgi:hypothetical protein
VVPRQPSEDPGTAGAPDKTTWDVDDKGVAFEVFSERLKKRLDAKIPKMSHREVFDAVRACAAFVNSGAFPRS